MPTTSSPRSLARLRLLSMLAAAALATAGLAGCGGDSASSDSTQTTTSSDSGSSNSSGSGDDDAGRVRLAQCLRDNGVDLPDDIGSGGPPPANLDREQLQSLLQGECKEFAQGAFGNVSGDQQEEFQDAFAVFSQCMRENGVDLPDRSSGGAPPDAGAIDRDDPKFKTAQTACQDKLPQGLPGGGN